MVKFTSIGQNGEKLYGFGISEKNVEELKKDHPIYFDLKEMGGNGRILLFYGKTESEMAGTLNAFVGPNTKIKDPRD